MVYKGPPIYEYEFVIRAKNLGIDVPISIWLYDRLPVEPVPGAVLSQNDAEVVMRAMPEVADWNRDVTPAFVVIRDFLVRHLSDGAGAGDEKQARQLNRLLRVVSFFDLGVQWLCHLGGVVFADDSEPVTAAEVRELFAEQSEQIEVIYRHVEPLGRNAIIDQILKRGRANQKQAVVYLDRSDSFLRPYFNDPGDGAPDPGKLNGRKGAKEWSVTVEEMDRFNTDVLRGATPAADSDGVEIRKPT